MSRLALIGCATVLIALSCSAISSHELHDGDFAIGYNEHSGRPGILIAWRNTQKIFEAEVLVRNLGHGTAKAFTSLEIVDADGKILMRRPENGEGVQVSVRGKEDGGEEGAVVQVLGSLEANQLIDRLDREKKVYTIQSRVTSIEGDTNPLNNVAGKTLNAETQILPGSTKYYQFSVSNPSDVPKDYELLVERHGISSDWNMELDQKPEELFTIPARTIRQITAKLTGSAASKPIERGDLIFRILDRSRHEISMVREWFVSSDTEAPNLIDKETIVRQQDGSIYFEVVAFDAMPGLKEGTAVRLEYSTDDGFTFSDKIMAYADGDFTRPTRFTSELGPFRTGTKLKVALVLSDSVGNIRRMPLPGVDIK